MTDINDDYSPHDAADEARAEDPPDGYGQRPPLDLDELQKLYDLAAEPGGLPSWGRIVYLRVPDLIAELREARERIAEFEALEKREEWAVTARREVVPSKSMPLLCESADSAAKAVKVSGGVLWVRRLTVHPWEPIVDESPF